MLARTELMHAACQCHSHRTKRPVPPICSQAGSFRPGDQNKYLWCTSTVIGSVRHDHCIPSAPTLHSSHACTALVPCLHCTGPMPALHSSHAAGRGAHCVVAASKTVRVPRGPPAPSEPGRPDKASPTSVRRGGPSADQDLQTEQQRGNRTSPIVVKRSARPSSIDQQKAEQQNSDKGNSIVGEPAASPNSILVEPAASPSPTEQQVLAEQQQHHHRHPRQGASARHTLCAPELSEQLQLRGAAEQQQAPDRVTSAPSPRPSRPLRGLALGQAAHQQQERRPTCIARQPPIQLPAEQPQSMPPLQNGADSDAAAPAAGAEGPSRAGQPLWGAASNLSTFSEALSPAQSLHRAPPGGETQPALVVFSGGTAFNSVAGADADMSDWGWVRAGPQRRILSYTASVWGTALWIGTCLSQFLPGKFGCSSRPDKNVNTCCSFPRRPLGVLQQERMSACLATWRQQARPG